MDTPENTDPPNTKETDKTFCIKQRELFNQKQVGEWCLTILPGREDIGILSNSFHISVQDATEQNQTTTHHKTSIEGRLSLPFSAGQFTPIT